MFIIFKETPVLNAYSVDHGQTPRSAASDLDQYSLPMSLLEDSLHKLINAWGLDHFTFHTRKFLVTKMCCMCKVTCCTCYQNVLHLFSKLNSQLH